MAWTLALASRANSSRRRTTHTLVTIINAVSAVLVECINVINTALLPPVGVANDPIALLLWTFLVLTLLGAVWRFVRTFTHKKTSSAASGSPPAQAARADSDRKRRPRRASRSGEQRTPAEQQTLSFWTRMFIRLRVVQLSLNDFASLSKADRARYAGDKRYDPRYAYGTRAADVRGFERDRERRMQAQRERTAWRSVDQPSQRRRRQSLPKWMQAGQTVQRGIDPLTGQYNAEWERLSDPEYEVPPENPAYVALFERPPREL